MAIPLAVLGLGSLITTGLSFVGRLLGTAVASVFSQFIIASILTFAVTYFLTTKVDAFAWALAQITTMLPQGMGVGSFVFPLGGVVEALRIIDCLMVIINAWFIGLSVSMLKDVMGHLANRPSVNP